ncbi:TfoX/Sxy family protein [Schlesneria paludicola]|uniref:TfoX/Sxy family protein n=1 Tax=Schlesneria paludicola TaxID=360056 RepID=UPI00029AAE93
MAYDEDLAERVRAVLAARLVSADERPMMGGLCFMVDGKMCLGISKNRLMARIDRAIYDEALTRKGCIPMEITGRPMRGFVFVTPEGLRSKRNLESWVDLALEFNPRAVASRRRGSIARPVAPETATPRKPDRPLAQKD